VKHQVSFKHQQESALEDILAADNIIIEEDDEALTTQQTGTKDMIGFTGKPSLGGQRSLSTNLDKTKQ
jgi:hypothetical protein